MKLKDFLLTLSPELEKKIDSPQFAYAKRLVQLRVGMQLTQQQMADFAVIQHNNLVEMEFASTNHTIEQYRDTIALIESAIQEAYARQELLPEEYNLILQTYPTGEPPFSVQDLEEENVEDLQDWVNEDALLAIVSEEAGGIIGYIQKDHADFVAGALNLHRIERNRRQNDEE